MISLDHFVNVRQKIIPNIMLCLDEYDLRQLLVNNYTIIMDQSVIKRHIENISITSFNTNIDLSRYIY